MRTQAISLKATAAIAALALAIVACGGSDSAEPSTTAATEAAESMPPGTDSTVDTAAAPTTDVASIEQADSGSCSKPESTGLVVDIGVVAQFDNEVGQNAEGIAFDAAGNTYVSFAQLGQIVRLGADAAGHEVVGEIPGWDDPFPGMGGIAFDTAGNLYAAVGGGETSGVWLFECGQGEPTRISGTESIGLPNALVFDDFDNLYITDSNSGVADDETPLGAVWRISAAGEVDLWAEDVKLGGTGAIGIGPIGANGVAINGDQIYVAVTEQNSIVEISILDDESAGPVSVFATSNMIEFVEGVAVAPNGTVFAVEAWANSVVIVGADGSITPIAMGVDGDIDQPANIVVGVGPGSESMLYVTNNARFSNLDGGIGSSMVAISTEPA